MGYKIVVIYRHIFLSFASKCNKCVVSNIIKIPSNLKYCQFREGNRGFCRTIRTLCYVIGDYQWHENTLSARLEFSFLLKHIPYHFVIVR